MDGQSFFVRGERKALTFSLNLTRFIRTPVNANNGHLTLAHRTDCFAVYFEGEKAFGWSLQHVDLPERNSTPNMDESFSFSNRPEIFECFCGFSRRNDVSVTVRDVWFDNVNVLYTCSLISLVFCSNETSIFLNLNNVTRLIRITR